jgi:hypothetical protein
MIVPRPPVDDGEVIRSCANEHPVELLLSERLLLGW